MANEVTLSLSQTDAAELLRVLQLLAERLSDIRQPLCETEPADEMEREEAGFFKVESAVVERTMVVLKDILKKRGVES
ncbi:MULTISPECIES: hypothetical protein [Methylocystis]|nr:MULTISPECIES: hypothetical protein [Methylocystis]MDJ0450884.1 hypothetical protein [Methylocystis sp. JR02]